MTVANSVESHVNEMSTTEAGKYYASLGIVTQPLKGAKDKCKCPGKEPILNKWQRIEKPFTDNEIDQLFSDNKNIGYVCGERSNLTLVDIDWIRKGIWENVFSGVDTSEFVKVSHNDEKYHLLFKYCGELKAGKYKFLGFDILSDSPVTKDGVTYIAGDNCVCAPSIHSDGNQYKIDGNIEDRIYVPKIVIRRLNNLISIYDDITKTILPKCRQWFRKLWNSIFNVKESALYHDTTIFHGDMESRIRFLQFCAELKVNGATDNHLHTVCMVIFGDLYDNEKTTKELGHIGEKPATLESVLRDPYFKEFFSINDNVTTTRNDVTESPPIENEDIRTRLKNLQLPESKGERIAIIKKFTLDNLIRLSESGAESIIFIDMKEYFTEFTDREAGIVFKYYKEKRKEKNPPKTESEVTEKENAEYRINQYPAHVRDKAYNTLKYGDSFTFLMNNFNKLHVGDINVGQNCMCSVAATYILNSRGLPHKPSGESGKGKSDASDTALKLLPPHKYITGSLSAKVLFYAPIKEGTIIFTDDTIIDPEKMSTIKQMTSNFQNPTPHYTLKNQEYLPLKIPPRVTIWLSSVETIQDDQVANRFLQSDIDGSAKQDQAVLDHIKEMELSDNIQVDEDIQTCQCIFDLLDTARYHIRVPFVKAIEWRNPENRRNFPKFLDIIRSVTLFNIFQREEINGKYLATIEDYERALEIYKGTAKNNATNLGETELKALQIIAGKNTYNENGFVDRVGETTLKDLVTALNLSHARVYGILHGKVACVTGGMLSKVQHLQFSKVSDYIDAGDNKKRSTSKNVYTYTGKRLGFEIYDTVAVLDKKKAAEEIEAFMETCVCTTVTTVTRLSPDCHHGKVTALSRTVDNCDTNYHLKEESKIEIENSLYRELHGNICHIGSSPVLSQTTESGDSGDSVSLCTVHAITARGDSRVTVGDSESASDDQGVTVTHHNDCKNKKDCDNIECNPGVQPRCNHSATIKDDLENLKALKFLRKEIETQKNTFIRKHGGIENIGEFVEEFLKNNPGLRNSWSFDTIFKEAEKICKKIPSEFSNNRDMHAFKSEIVSTFESVLQE